MIIKPNFRDGKHYFDDGSTLKIKIKYLVMLDDHIASPEEQASILVNPVQNENKKSVQFKEVL